MMEKYEDIKHIQNTIWAMYRAYLKDHDMKAYNRKMGELSKEYYDKGDKQLSNFCDCLLITWAPIIMGFAMEFNEGREDADA